MWRCTSVLSLSMTMKAGCTILPVAEKHLEMEHSADSIGFGRVADFIKVRAPCLQARDCHLQSLHNPAWSHM